MQETGGAGGETDAGGHDTYVFPILIHGPCLDDWLQICLEAINVDNPSWIDYICLEPAAFEIRLHVVEGYPS